MCNPTTEFEKTSFEQPLLGDRNFPIVDCTNSFAIQTHNKTFLKQRGNEIGSNKIVNKAIVKIRE